MPQFQVRIITESVTVSHRRPIFRIVDDVSATDAKRHARQAFEAKYPGVPIKRITATPLE